ncbi:MAG: DUF6265 family protein [Candidatus Aminicenantes bacterium]|jgi:hypothetical protein
MKIIGLLFLIIFLWVGIAVPVEVDSGLHKLHWLVGQWKGQLGKNTYYESWKPTNHGPLEGRASMVNPQGKTSFTEVLRIDKIGSHIAYIAVVNKNNPVLFTLIENSEENNKPKWVFENKEHDFPQRIIYIRESSDSLLARVEGVLKGKKEQDEFRLIKEK